VKNHAKLFNLTVFDTETAAPARRTSGPVADKNHNKRTQYMKTPTLLEMLQSGVHFGHRTSKRHPNMEPYIFSARQNVHIINLEETQRKLEEALKVLVDMAARGKTILFVGTKKQAAAIVKKEAEACGMPYVTTRWLGGLLTNFKNVSTVPRKLTTLKADRDSGDLSKYTKKEQLDFEKEIAKLEIMVGGIETMTKMPDAVFIVDLKEEKTTVREAAQTGIPIFALCDTNTDPLKVQYPIPANDDAVKSIEMMMSAVAGAINEGKANPVEQPVNKQALAGSKGAPRETKK